MKNNDFNNENNNSSLNDEEKVKKLENNINKEIKNLFNEMNLSYNEKYIFKINDINNINEEYQKFLNRILKKYFDNVSNINVNKLKRNLNNKIGKSSSLFKNKNNIKDNKDDIFKYENKIYFLLTICVLILIIYKYFF